MRGIILSKCGS